jgi:hypothetical protein
MNAPNLANILAFAAIPADNISVLTIALDLKQVLESPFFSKNSGSSHYDFLNSEYPGYFIISSSLCFITSVIKPKYDDAFPKGKLVNAFSGPFHISLNVFQPP